VDQAGSLPVGLPPTSDAAPTIESERVDELTNPQERPNPMDLIRVRGHILVERWEELHECRDEVGAAHVADEIAFLNALSRDLLEETGWRGDSHTTQLAELEWRIRWEREHRAAGGISPTDY